MSTPSDTSPSTDWSDEEKRHSLLRRWQRSPLAFCQEALNFHPWPGQERILAAVGRRTASATGGNVVVPTGHGVGKSSLIGCLVPYFLTLNERVTVITTASVWRQVKKIAWSEIRERVQHARVPFSAQPMSLEWRLGERRFAIGLSTKDPTKFQGLHNDIVIVIVDEASGVPRPVWEAIRGSASGHRDLVIALGNPTDPTSYFYDLCAGRVPDTEKVHISSVEAADWNEQADEPIVGLASWRYINGVRAEFGEDSSVYAARVLGEFPKESDEALIRLAWIDAANERWEEGEEDLDDLAAVGCDVARYGADLTVWFGMRGRRVVHIEQLAKGDLMRVAGQTAALAKQLGAQAVAIDDTGLGGGVTDRLAELGWDVGAINFGAKPRDEDRFHDCRTELWWDVREALREGRLDLPRNEPLLRDLLAPRYTYTSRGRLKLEPKEMTRKRLGRSPDYGDALAIAWAAPGSLADYTVDDMLPGVPRFAAEREIL